MGRFLLSIIQYCDPLQPLLRNSTRIAWNNLIYHRNVEEGIKRWWHELMMSYWCQSPSLLRWLRYHGRRSSSSAGCSVHGPMSVVESSSERSQQCLHCSQQWSEAKRINLMNLELSSIFLIFILSSQRRITEGENLPTVTFTIILLSSDKLGKIGQKWHW